MDGEHYPPDSDNNYSYEYSFNESNVCEMGDYFVFYTHLTTVLYTLIFLLSLLGNTLVLWILFKYENLTSLTNVFIMNLCVSDLVFSCMLPFWAVDQSFGWIFGEFLCKAVNAVFSIGYYSGVFFLTLMTILRYLSVVNPLSTLRSQTQCCGFLVSLVGWTGSILIVVPEMIHTTVQENLEGIKICDYADSFTAGRRFSFRQLTRTERGNLLCTGFITPFVFTSAVCAESLMNPERKLPQPCSCRGKWRFLPQSHFKPLCFHQVALPPPPAAPR